MTVTSIHHWLTSLALFSILAFVLSGCPSDPNDVTIDDIGAPTDDTGLPDADSPEPDANGHSGDTNAGEIDIRPDPDPDAGGDTDSELEPELPCTVPDEATLAEAVNEGCDTIDIVADLGADEIGLDGDPIAVDGELTVEGGHHRLEVSHKGLFSVAGSDAHLAIHELSINAGTYEDTVGDSEPGTPVMSISDGGQLTTSDITIDGFQSSDQTIIEAFDNAGLIELDSFHLANTASRGPLVAIEDTETLRLNNSTFKDNELFGAGTLAIACQNSAVELIDDTRFSNHSISIDEGIDTDDPANLISLSDCDLTIEQSQISDTSITLDRPHPAVSSVRCTGDSQIGIHDDSHLTGHTINFSHTMLDQDLDIAPAGLDLHGCDLHLSDSTIADNTTTVVVEDFDNDQADPYTIALGGTGLHLHQGMLTLDAVDILNNTITVTAHNDTSDSTNIVLDTQIYGAGIGLRDAEASISDTAVRENKIELSYTGFIAASQPAGLASGAGIDFGTAGDESLMLVRSAIEENSILHEGPSIYHLNARGAGLSTHFAEDGQLEIRQSTIAENEITGADTVLGAGLSFIAADDAQLRMVNSTISTNSIQEADLSRGAGLYIEGPPGVDESDTIVDQETLEDIWGTYPLTAIIRYSTIAFNQLEEDGQGSGLYIDNETAGTSSNTDETVFVSLVGLMLHKNSWGDDIYDCEGAATFAEIDDNTVNPNGNSDDLEWGSGYNLISFFEVGNEQLNCFNMLSDSNQDTVATAADSDFNIGALETYLGSPTRLHLPESLSEGTGAIDEGQQGQCSDLSGPGPLTNDQTDSTTRPQNGYCDIGSVEVAP